MSDILHKAKADYFKKSETLSHVISVPEWDAEFHIKPATLKDRQWIQSYIDLGDLTAIAATVVARCCDADGEKVFKKADMDELCQAVDSEVLARIAREINFNPGHPEDLDEAKKPLETTVS